MIESIFYMVSDKKVAPKVEVLNAEMKIEPSVMNNLYKAV
jgi:hypothetical protein